ncbi:MAG: class II glutamine amidotransferase [Rubrivivax sp.]|nr:MAG: class II glutamine amidotransferase [Rubrivivax sp.]
MCRFLAYSGDAIFLEDLVCKPRHSLVRQSLQASEAKTATNGDGFGIGWYGERDTPGVYRECMPAWSDENLLALCANVRSRLFMARVQAGATLEAAVRQVLLGTVDEMAARGIETPLRFSAALADGEQLWAVRWASDDKPPSLYIKPQPGGWAIASEPLGDDAEAWSPLAKGELVHVHDGRIERRLLCDAKVS